MYKKVAAGLGIVILLALIAMTIYVTKHDAEAIEPEEPEEEIVFEVLEKPYTPPEPEPEPEPEETVEETYYEPDYSSYSSYSYPTEGLTPSGGVNYYDGRRETYYSSNVLYHYRTSEWWVDNEGFYRTDEGYYVVAASDMEQGTTFEGSKGTCVVLDSGCAEGTTDYYVQW